LLTSSEIAVLNVPVLETERLRLRGHTAKDGEASAALWADASVTRFIGGRPHTGEESWARLLRYVGHWSLLGYGYWLVEEKATGAFVGEMGLADYRREIEPRFDGTPEIGWVVAPDYQGKGYATEAIQAIMNWAAQELGAEIVVCLIHPENEASLKVANRFGFEERVRTIFHGEPAIVLEKRLSDRRSLATTVQA
jgi:RimJ/RimL family protein N-acetyltransferase